MRHRLLASLGGAAVVVALLAAGPRLVAGQAQSGNGSGAATSGGPVARTPWGDPDLNGIWSAGYFFTTLERPEKYAGREFLTDEEVAALERDVAATFGIGGGAGGNQGKGRPERGTDADVAGAYNDIFSGRGRDVIRTKRTSLIIDPPDGRLPPLTPEGQQRADARRRVNTSESGPGGPADYPEQRPSNDRCVGVTLPVSFGNAAAAGAHSRIVQSPGSVAIYYEHGHHGGAYRTIPLGTRAPLPPSIRQWLGDARGRWEGDTLVIETKNFTNQTNYYGSAENLQLVERYRRVQPDMILYTVTITDPTTFTKPWTIEVPFSRLDDKENKIFESACHEGNYAMTSILAGARMADKESARKGTK